MFVCKFKKDATCQNISPAFTRKTVLILRYIFWMRGGRTSGERADVKWLEFSSIPSTTRENGEKEEGGEYAVEYVSMGTSS